MEISKMKNKDHPTPQQRIVVASCITVSPSGECKLSVDVGDEQTDRQMDKHRRRLNSLSCTMRSGDLIKS